jgi:hypothetical protein
MKGVCVRGWTAFLAALVFAAAGCGLSTPTECGRLSSEDCTTAVQVAKALLPSDFNARRIVAESPCGPDEGCAGGWRVFVVFEADDGDDLAFFVQKGGETVQAVAFPPENLPRHIISMLDSR